MALAVLQVLTIVKLTAESLIMGLDVAFRIRLSLVMATTRWLGAFIRSFLLSLLVVKIVNFLLALQPISRPFPLWLV